MDARRRVKVFAAGASPATSQICFCSPVAVTRVDRMYSATARVYATGEQKQVLGELRAQGISADDVDGEVQAAARSFVETLLDEK